jgi:hypothetical protein
MASPAVTYNAPSFYNDPNYAASQNSLMPFASSLMSGQGLPAAYSGLITPNSPQFQQMLQRTTGNILGATEDQMAGQGISDSGVAASAAAGAVGNATSTLTYQDFLNSQANQLHLMDSGAGIMENVGSMALNNQGQNNQFNLTNASESLDSQEFNAQMKQQQDQMWASMISSGIGALGNVAGMGMLGGFGGGGGSTSSTLGASGVPSVNQWAAFMQ